MGKPVAGWLRRARQRAGRVRRARRRAGKVVRPWREDRAALVEDRRIEQLARTREGVDELVRQHQVLTWRHRIVRQQLDRCIRSTLALKAELDELRAQKRSKTREG